jgi:hypothetical protein
MSDPDLEEVVTSLRQALHLANARRWPQLRYFIELTLQEAVKTAKELGEGSHSEAKRSPPFTTTSGALK